MKTEKNLVLRFWGSVGLCALVARLCLENNFQSCYEESHMTVQDSGTIVLEPYTFSSSEVISTGLCMKSGTVVLDLIQISILFFLNWRYIIREGRGVRFKSSLPNGILMPLTTTSFGWWWYNFDFSFKHGCVWVHDFQS